MLRRLVRDNSVATRLSLVVLLVALISLVITSTVALLRAGELADDVLQERLESLGAARADQVEQYFRSVERSANLEAISPHTATAIGDLAGAYQELQDGGPSRDDTEAVEEYYRDVVVPELAAVRGRPVSVAGVIPRQPAAVHLQANYVVPSDDGAAPLADAGDASRWSELHATLNPSYQELAIQAGVDDLYLIEPNDKTIVYSTAKGNDFGTSLGTGPYSGSALAVLINSFGDQPEPGAARIADFTSYPAAGDEPSLFIAGPVVADGALAGFVAFRIGPEPVSSITTDGGSWIGQGDTGETYVVARDDFMRTDARGFVEDERSFLTAVIDAGTTTEMQTRSMATFGTTVLFQQIDNEDVDDALDEEPSLVNATNYLGREVLQARRALEIEGLEWAMIVEVERVEIEQPIVDFIRNLLVAIAVFLVVITFFAVRWSDRLVQPLRIISSRLRVVRAGGEIEEGTSSALLPAGSPKEFKDLAGDIDTMLETLAARNADVEERTAERRELLRRILPPQVAQRAEAGERDVVDQVANATVAVVVITGLGPLLRAGTADARSLLDRFVEEADAVARQRGLERIRLTGDAYFAACGTARPHIDHAVRAVQFVLDVREIIRDLNDIDQGISISAGVDSGPVTVGLTGGSGLVYDAWGSTVQRAADLARRSGPNEVLVAAAARSQLGSTFVIDDRVDPIDGRTTARVLRRAEEAQPAR
jgi:class 3 adenylate cyclase